MAQRIERDVRRFRRLVDGALKNDLKKYMSQGELIGRQGKDFISIPMPPKITIPKFVYGDKGNGGATQGDGDVGTPLGPTQQGDDDGGGGQGEGQHIREVDVSFGELAQILKEKLQLPNLGPKVEGDISEEKYRYTSIRRRGPESLRHFRRMYLQSLRRQIAAGTYDPENPKLDFIKDDKRYKGQKSHPEPKTQAVVIYMMDVSGSVTDAMKEIVRAEAFWIDLWLKDSYKKGVESVFIIHDEKAKLVDRDTFFHTKESGGTKISSALSLANRVASGRAEVNNKLFNPRFWNIYPFYFGDGDNFSQDNAEAITELRELIERSSLVGYFEVGSSYSSNTFLTQIEGNITDEKQKEKIRTTKTPTKDDIMDSFRAVFQARQQTKSAV